jgi:hypothetical protein
MKTSTFQIVLVSVLCLLFTSCSTQTFKARNIDDPFQEQGVDDYTEFKVSSDEDLSVGDTARFKFVNSGHGGKWKHTTDTTADRFVLFEEVIEK